jgi:hypothetical protein
MKVHTHLEDVVDLLLVGAIVAPVFAFAIAIVIHAATGSCVT